MSMNADDAPDTPKHTDAYYETIASQEEIYMEETEETLRAILISYDPYPRSNGSTLAETDGEGKLDQGRRSISEANSDPWMAESLDEQLQHIAEQLITGDSDDPPIGHEAILEMLKVSLIVRRLGPV